MNLTLADGTLNGLQELAPLGNLTAVGCLIVLVVWMMTRGFPKLLDRHDIAMQRKDTDASTERAAFRAVLDRQADVREVSARSGHEAAHALAESIRDLSEEVRRSGVQRHAG